LNGGENGEGTTTSSKVGSLEGGGVEYFHNKLR
jgi:hypothetical protein